VKELKDKIVKVEGKHIQVTNPDKILFPDISMTKWDYVMHMARLAPFMLPYTRDRLLTVIRYPDGVRGKHFYQKNIPSYAPDWVETKTDGDNEYILLQNTATLVWLATQAALEFHTSFHLAGSDIPAELVFDLDPSREGFEAVTEVALLLHQVLQSIGLNAFAKTSGATGIQVYVPIERRYSFKQTRRVGQFLGKYLQERHPRLVTLERMKRLRGHKVYFDYLQHWHGKTIAAPYSPRARAQAPVSTPVSWRELEKGVHPDDFTLLNIHRRLEVTGDIFQNVLDVRKRQSLDAILHVIRT
jgi:bifunctional non-homologous end joining protein LigD